MRPLIGITVDRNDEKYSVGHRYAHRIAAAEGLPVLLPTMPERIPQFLECCDGFVFTGGDDPIMEPYGEPTNPNVTPVHHERQRFERALLQSIERDPSIPVLGVCLGMQYMALEHDGRLDQWLRDSCPTHDDHWGHKHHPIRGSIGQGVIASLHRQAISDPGGLDVLATAHDGVIEAVGDPDRPFYVGVQWHPERTENPELGVHLFHRLIDAAIARRNARI